MVRFFQHRKAQHSLTLSDIVCLLVNALYQSINVWYYSLKLVIFNVERIVKLEPY
jgi:hypothetical protein